MSDSTVPAIDAKQTDQQNSDQSSDSSSGTSSDQMQWGVFLQLSIWIAVVVVLFSIIGANFVTLLSFEPISLLLPVDAARYYRDSAAPKPKPGPVPRKNTMPCRYGASSKGATFTLPRFSDMGIDGNAYGWPYSMYKKGASELSFQGFENWFASTTADSYIWLRQALTDFLELRQLDLHPIFLFFFASIVVSLAPTLLPFIASFIILPFKGFTSGQWGWMWALMGLFLVWTPMMMGCNMVIQYLQVLALFLIMPLFVDLKTVKEVLRCNSWWISIIFGFCIASAGLQTLGMVPGVVMLLAWALSSSRTIMRRLDS